MASAPASQLPRSPELSESHDPLWLELKAEAEIEAKKEPPLASFLHACVLNHDALYDALGFILAAKLENPMLSSMETRDLFREAGKAAPELERGARADLLAVRERDPAAHYFSRPFLFYKGFHAIQAHRIAHWLWNQGREPLALYFQSRCSEVFGVDIHPAARLGRGLMIDHATAVVVGETAVIEDDVSMLHSVTLGGTGKDHGDRHPKVRRGVLIGAGASILGNVQIGEGAKIGAGSVVLADVPPHVTVAGVPAEIVGRAASEMPALEMDHSLDCFS